MYKEWKVLGIVVGLLYFWFTVFAVWKLYCAEGNDNLEDKIVTRSQNHEIQPALMSLKKSIMKSIPVQQELGLLMKNIEIWGKASIGMYFWIHVMNSKLETFQDGLVTLGNLTVGNTVYTFRSGPGIIQSTVPLNVEYLVLILNGRNKDKIDAATLWMDYLPQYSQLKKLAVILLGNEECNNSWILPYMKAQGGRTDVVFMVYDSLMIDNINIFQWPLGVAVYRGFPNILPHQVDITSKRSYLCNFLGTVYEKSSRVTLTQVIKSSGFEDKCIVTGRKSWLPLETKETFSAYMFALSNSDLTLCPVGKNTECYRIYEAMSLGSIPVIEDVVTSGNCDRFKRSPLRLLKEYNAPVIFINDWSTLPQLLYQESQLTLVEKVKRRRTLIEWYKQFKEVMRDKFTHVIEDKFFGG